MRLPKALCKGSKVAVIAPSSPAPEEQLERGLAALRDMGFEPLAGRSCTVRTPERGYLAGDSDSLKISDIHWAFSDDSIDGIVCLRGGSGAGRLIRFLDAGLIAANPKIFVGYSDITILHSYIMRNCGFVTFHGPMPASDALHDEDSPTRKAFLRALTDPAPLGAVTSLRGPAEERGANELFQVPQNNSVRGKLVGGNLALLCTTLGTCAEVETKGNIVLLEDTDEEPYSVDRLLNHLINAGKLIDAAGIVLGDFTNCEPPEQYRCRAVQDVIRDVLPRLGVPVVGGLRIGHGRINLTVPLGVQVRLDTEEKALYFEKPALSV